MKPKSKLSAQDKKVIAMVDDFRLSPMSYYHFQWPTEETWYKQDEMARSLVESPETWVRACQSSSKTHSAGRFAQWHYDMWYPSIVVFTAPTLGQIKNGIWANFQDAWNRKKLPSRGELVPGEMRVNDKADPLHYVTCLNPDKPESLQGIHLPNGKILIIVDEASGVSEAVWSAIDSLMTDPRVRLFVIGNPIRNTGKYFNVFNASHPNRRLIHIDGFDAVKESKRISGLITQEYIDAYDKDDPMYDPRCRGNFPTKAINSVIPMADIDNAIHNQITIIREPLKFGSIDWGFGGDDDTVFNSWNNAEQIGIESHKKKQPMESVGLALVCARKYGWKYIFGDVGGGGKVENDLLRDALGYNTPGKTSEIEVIDINSAAEGAQVGNEVYYNLRALMAYNARDMLHSGEVKLLSSPTQREDLLADRSYMHRSGKIIIIDKKEIKKELKRSPNEGDACKIGLWGLKVLRDRRLTEQPPQSQPWMYQEVTSDSKESNALGVRTE